MKSLYATHAYPRALYQPRVEVHRYDEVSGVVCNATVTSTCNYCLGELNRSGALTLTLIWRNYDRHTPLSPQLIHLGATPSWRLRPGCEGWSCGLVSEAGDGLSQFLVPPPPPPPPLCSSASSPDSSLDIQWAIPLFNYTPLQMTINGVQGGIGNMSRGWSFKGLSQGVRRHNRGLSRGEGNNIHV